MRRVIGKTFAASHPHPGRRTVGRVERHSLIV
jgi:hypothetical protein